MNVDDLLCVGATNNILVSSTIGRNKNLIPGEVIAAIINRTNELCEELTAMGVRVYPTGGETADVGDLVRTIIVDSTVTCRMRRADVIDNARIQAGDVIVGLSSSGQATYEKEYNGGMGSNGSPRRDTTCSHTIWQKIPGKLRPIHPGALDLFRQPEVDGDNRKGWVWMPGSWYYPHPHLCAHYITDTKGIKRNN